MSCATSSRSHISELRCSAGKLIEIPSYYQYAECHWNIIARWEQLVKSVYMHIYIYISCFKFGWSLMLVACRKDQSNRRTKDLHLLHICEPRTGKGIFAIWRPAQQHVAINRIARTRPLYILFTTQGASLVAE